MASVVSLSDASLSWLFYVFLVTAFAARFSLMALWAGLPVVTKIGLGFAARVAGSLLNAVGLPDLITETEKDYEALILKLATHPTKLAEIKEKLAINRLTQPLFNTELYTKHLENGYQKAYQNYFDGNLPQTIIVPK